MDVLNEKMYKVDTKISKLTKTADHLSETIQQAESHLKQVSVGICLPSESVYRNVLNAINVPVAR